jgi:hypothetical protein
MCLLNGKNTQFIPSLSKYPLSQNNPKTSIITLKLPDSTIGENKFNIEYNFTENRYPTSISWNQGTRQNLTP